MKRVKITVLKTEYDPVLAEKYLTEGDVGPCPIHRPGQVFWYEGGAEMPEGFCPWAWVDLFRAVHAKAGNVENTWYKPGVSIACCTDGIRPVIFELSTLEEPDS